VLSTVSTKPQRSAQPLSASVPSGGPVQALPGPGRFRFRKSQRSKRTSQSRLRHILLPPTTPTAGGSGQQPDPRTVRVSPSDLHRSTAPRRRNRSLAMRPFPATRCSHCAGDLNAGDRLASAAAKGLNLREQGGGCARAEACVPVRSPFPLMGKGWGWGGLLSRRWRVASDAEITPPLPLPIEGRGLPPLTSIAI
jgi:hypothetical protein